MIDSTLFATPHVESRPRPGRSTAATSYIDHRSHLGCFQLLAVGSGITTLLLRFCVRLRRSPLYLSSDEQVESVPKV